MKVRREGGQLFGLECIRRGDHTALCGIEVLLAL